LLDPDGNIVLIEESEEDQEPDSEEEELRGFRAHSLPPSSETSALLRVVKSMESLATSFVEGQRRDPLKEILDGGNSLGSSVGGVGDSAKGLQVKAVLRAHKKDKPRPIWMSFEERVREKFQKPVSYGLAPLMYKWEESVRFAGNVDMPLMFHAELEHYLELRSAYDLMGVEAKKLTDGPLASMALSLIGAEQYSMDGCQWDLGWHYTLLSTPPSELYWRRTRSKREDPEALAASAGPRWGTALLSYLGMVDSVQRRRTALRAATLAAPDPNLGQDGAPAHSAAKPKVSWADWRTQQKEKATAETLGKKK